MNGPLHTHHFARCPWDKCSEPFWSRFIFIRRFIESCDAWRRRFAYRLGSQRLKHITGRCCRSSCPRRFFVVPVSLCGVARGKVICLTLTSSLTSFSLLFIIIIIILFESGNMAHTQTHTDIQTDKKSFPLFSLLGLGKFRKLCGGARH